MSLERYLVLLVPSKEFNYDVIKNIGLEKLIVRKLSYCLELDFRSSSINNDLEGITLAGDIISIEKAEHDSGSFDPSSTDSFKTIIDETQKLIDAERYWKAHTLLELIWKHSNGDRKKGFQGIIWLLVSLVHYQMMEPEISRNVYARARGQIRSSGFTCIFNQLPDQFAYPLRISLNCLMENYITR